MDVYLKSYSLFRKLGTIIALPACIRKIFTPHCKQQLTESTGTVNSPNYPAPYPKSSDCYWTITTAPGSAIRLLFAFFQTQEKRDFVYVYILFY